MKQHVALSRAEPAAGYVAAAGRAKLPGQQARAAKQNVGPPKCHNGQRASAQRRHPPIQTPLAEVIWEKCRRRSSWGIRPKSPLAGEKKPGDPLLSTLSRGAKAQAADAGSEADDLPKTAEEDWWLKKDPAIRTAPLVAGTAGGLLVVLNRALSGVAPVADAGSSQSRADVLCLVVAATLLLTGLVWKSLQPKSPVTVGLDGMDCLEVNSALPDTAQQELRWAWEALRGATRCRSLVVVYGGATALQAGKAQESLDQPGTPLVPDVSTLLEGSICRTVRVSKRVNYIANLALFPGRFELPFFPPNTQAVIVQPLGESGVMLLGADTIRGFAPLDQAWIETVAQKLDSTLQDWLDTSQS